MKTLVRFSGFERRIRLARGLLLTIVGSILFLWAEGASREGDARFKPTADEKQALARISASSLRGHLSFVASDALQGRDTPSPGLEIAAEYIAAQFRRAGLDPAGDDGYFQTAQWIVVTPNPEGFRFTFAASGKSLEIPATKFSMTGIAPLRLENVPLYKIPFSEQSLDHVGMLEGMAVITESPDRSQDRERTSQALRGFLNRLASLKPRAVVMIDRRNRGDSAYFYSRALKSPEGEAPPIAQSKPKTITVNEASAVELFDSMPSGMTKAAISLNLADPVEKTVLLRNVVGLLRGSDPVLKESYVLLTAHYDHIGTRPNVQGDKIWNGANDNGSGTVSVIEIASALATLKEKPRRSLGFIALFGEEKGILGSRYYARHPVFPIEKTVAAVNLEQVGRSDSTEGDQRGRASLTGFDYSDIGETFRSAGEQSGIKVYKHEQKSDPYFSRSDNQAFADLGIPSHTVLVAFDYSDYHRASDHWDKIDYDNMANTDQMIALALLMLAQDHNVPRWNGANPRAAPYLKAWEERHPK